MLELLLLGLVYVVDGTDALLVWGVWELLTEVDGLVEPCTLYADRVAGRCWLYVGVYPGFCVCCVFTLEAAGRVYVPCVVPEVLAEGLR